MGEEPAVRAVPAPSPGCGCGQVEDTGDAVVISDVLPGRHRRAARCAERRLRGFMAGTRGRWPMARRAAGRCWSRCRCAGSAACKTSVPERPRSPSRPAGVSERYRRRSVPLLGMLASFGLELAGQSRRPLAGTLGIAGPLRPPCCAWSWRCRSRRSPPRRRSSGWMTSRCARGTCTARCWSTSAAGDAVDLLPDREAATLASRGWRPIPVRRSSAGTAPAPTRRAPATARRTPSRSPIAGTCGTTWQNPPRRR